LVHISDAGHYKPGDMPPEGYIQWHEWAEVQRKAGIKQVTCAHCDKWFTPQELSGHVHVQNCKDRFGKPVINETAVCIKCAGAKKLTKE